MIATLAILFFLISANITVTPEPGDSSREFFANELAVVMKIDKEETAGLWAVLVAKWSMMLILPS